MFICIQEFINKSKTISMGLFGFFGVLVVFFYLAIIIGVLYLIYTWVKKIISLKQEHNDLLREIIRKMENK